jgi:hypothetical protein
LRWSARPPPIFDRDDVVVTRPDHQVDLPGAWPSLQSRCQFDVVLRRDYRVIVGRCCHTVAGCS